MSPILEGFLLQAGLIWGLGAQNIFVVEAGIRRHHHLLVATLCSLCDAVLIFVGVSLASSMFFQNSYFQIAMGVVALLFLVIYGILKIRQGFDSHSIHINATLQKPSMKTVILLTLGFSLLNPHVYMDAILFLGSYSAKMESQTNKLYFAAGATAFSVIWFFGLSFLATRAGYFLSRPEVMRRASIISGSLLLMLALILSFKISETIF